VKRLAYVLGRYPAVSHAFILREVQGLRAMGIEVDTFSIRRSGPDEVLSAADREELVHTYSVLPPRIGDHVRAHLAALLARPRSYIRTLALAMRMAQPGLRGRLWACFYFGEGVVIWHRCARRGVRHLHAHFSHQASDAALLAASLGGDDWSWSMTIHGPAEFFDVSRYRLAEKAARARWVVCISDFARSQMMGLVAPERWERMPVVHCSADLARYPAADRAREPGEPLRILMVGRMIAIKGPHLVVEAVAALRDAGVDVRARLIGDGPERGRVEKLARKLGVADLVELPGYVGQDELADEYARADVFCLPSFAEGIPVVLMEAMATELPVVTTRIAGIGELVEDDVSGLLVRPGRPDLLFEALMRLAYDPDLRRRLGAAGREKVRAEFDLEGNARKLAAVFRDERAALAEVAA